MTSITQSALSLILTFALAGAPLLAEADTRPPLAGHQARIVFNDGRTVEGTIVSETRDAVRVGDRVIALADVATIDLANGDGKSNSRKNGFLIGALAGFALGVLYAPAASEWSAEAHYNPNGPTSGSSRTNGVVSIVGMALVFGGLGALIGHANGDNRPRYTKRIVIAGTTVDMAPAATLHSVGLNGSVKW